MGTKVVLLGPQGTTPDIGGVLAELGFGRVALVRAGYQERESEDAEMIATLGVPAVNLRLHARSAEVFRDDPELTVAYQARQQRLKHMQAFYRVRLDKIEDAAKTISVRHVPPGLLEEEDKLSIDQFRHIDLEHITRCRAVHNAFAREWKLGDRPVIARHRDELRAELDGCDALVLAGGHVVSLLNRLKLFDVLALAAGKPVVAWSAGAMVLTERIVLFHDYPPYGSDIAQVLDSGFKLVRDLVVLPNQKRRVNLEAREGIQRFARRMAPATCIAMNRGARVDVVDGNIVNARVIRLKQAGDVEHDWDGTPRKLSTPVLRGVPL